jgi:hypothetical protein
VRVTSTRHTTRASAALRAGGWIDGTVTGGAPVTAQPGVCVDAVGASGEIVNSATTGVGGRYQIGNLPPGSYRVYFGDPSCPDGPYDVTSQWYKGALSEKAAALVTVTSGTATQGIDAVLGGDGTVTGTVTGPAGSRLSGVCVSAIGLSREDLPTVGVSSGGAYTITGLPPGRYRVQFSSGCGASGYISQWWRDAGSERTASVLTVAAGAIVSGIDATLHR